MKILFTGGSSFSGMWFIKALVDAGHVVTSIFRQSYSDYTGLRKQRVDQLLSFCLPVFKASFGDAAFLDAISQYAPWDALCHHGAEVANYKSPDFNPALALASNTHNIKNVLQALQEKGCRRVILTGSIFEQNEGKGSENLTAVSPYGLSKGLTSDTFVFYTSLLGMKLGKFVIPNPFGPFEDERFTTYLAKCWLEGKVPSVNTPDYVRDNIPVSLLASSYAYFTTHLSSSPGFERVNPSFFAESLADFTSRFSEKISMRLNIACPYELKKQTQFNEPLVRINKDSIDAEKLQWKESLFWDNLAAFYTTLKR